MLRSNFENLEWTFVFTIDAYDIKQHPYTPIRKMSIASQSLFMDGFTHLLMYITSGALFGANYGDDDGLN